MALGFSGITTNPWLITMLILHGSPEIPLQVACNYNISIMETGVIANAISGSHTLIIRRFVHSPGDLLVSRDCIVAFVAVIINVALY